MTDFYAKFQSFEAMKDGWEETENKDTKAPGFTVTTVTRPHGGAKLVLAKHTIVLEKAEISQIASCFIDKWEHDEDAKEYKLIDKDDSSKTHYARFKIPIPFVSDRDILCKCGSEEKDDGTFIYTCSVDHPKQPAVKKVVRIDLVSVGLAVKNGDSVTFTYYEGGDSGNALLNAFDAKEVISDWTELVEEINK